MRGRQGNTSTATCTTARCRHTGPPEGYRSRVRLASRERHGHGDWSRGVVSVHVRHVICEVIATHPLFQLRRKECGNIGEKQGSGVVSTGHYEAALLYLVPCGATFTRPRAAERSVPVLRPRLGEYIRQDCESRDWKNMNVATHDTCRSSPVTCLNHVLETDDFGFISEVTGNKGGETTQRHQILSW